MNVPPTPATVSEPERRFWNEWNATFREGRSFASGTLDPESMRRGQAVLAWLDRLALPPRPRLLEVGCGTGWLTGELARRGSVTAVDLADEVVARARLQHPGVDFRAGDILALDLPPGGYDVAIALETVAYVADQAAFVARLSALLRPGGYLLVTSANPFVYRRRSDVRPVAPGQTRHWLTRSELRELFGGRFQIVRLTTVFPGGDRGVLRVANSAKLNRPLALFLGARRLERLKERAGLGRTIVALARAREPA